MTKHYLLKAKPISIPTEVHKIIHNAEFIMSICLASYIRATMKLYKDKLDENVSW